MRTTSSKSRIGPTGPKACLTTISNVSMFHSVVTGPPFSCIQSFVTVDTSSLASCAEPATLVTKRYTSRGALLVRGIARRILIQMLAEIVVPQGMEIGCWNAIATDTSLT